MGLASEPETPPGPSYRGNFTKTSIRGSSSPSAAAVPSVRRFFSHERTIAHHHASEVPATGFAEWEVRQKDFAPGSHQIAFCALFRHCRSSAGCGKLSSQLYSASVNPPFSDWLQTYERPLPATFQNQCADVVCAHSPCAPRPAVALHTALARMVFLGCFHPVFFHVTRSRPTTCQWQRTNMCWSCFCRPFRQILHNLTTFIWCGNRMIPHKHSCHLATEPWPGIKWSWPEACSFCSLLMDAGIH